MDNMTAIRECSVCGSADGTIITLDDCRRLMCSVCHHSERIDIERFDYTAFAMGNTGAWPERILSQANFVSPYVRAESSVLEIGCAAGLLAAQLRRNIDIRLYHGIEFSPASAEARNVMNRVFSRPLDALLNSGEIDTNAYDLVILSHCLEHMEDINGAIQSVRRAVNANGKIFIEVPNQSGHPDLAFDDNRSHIHFFGTSSLCRLLAKHGLETIMAQTGAWHDARYPDCLRIIARPQATEAVRPLLSVRLASLGIGKVVIWGAGRMVSEMFAHYMDPASIDFFVDRDPKKHGQILLGAPVRPIEALKHGCHTVLIGSIEFEASIRSQIQEQFPRSGINAIGLAELLSPNYSLSM